MEQEDGERKGSFKYYYQGYYYHKKECNKKKETSDFKTFRCTGFFTNCCPGIARENKKLGTVEIKHIHNHPPDQNVQAVSNLKGSILKRSKETELKPKHLFNKIVSQEPLEIGALVNFNSMRSSINRRRQTEGLPSIPKYLRDFKDVLENRFEPTKDLFRGLVEGNDGSAAALFASDLMISLLRSGDTKKVEIDATFSVTPREMSIYQLFTVHIIIRGTKFCALWALMTRKTSKLYLALWEKIILLAPELKENLKEIMSDFEPAIRNSVVKLIPGILKILCCWFHFCQALLRRWKKLGLCRLKAPKDVLWMCMNLALAPDTYFLEGLQLIQRVNQDHIRQFKEITYFLQYMHNQWLPLSKVLCVFNNARTNNGVESFHKNASNELGGIHPTMYDFLRKMSAYIKSEDMQYLRLLKGFAIRRNVPEVNITNDINILHWQNQLMAKKVTLEQFLKTAVTREYQENLNKLMDDILAEEDTEAGPNNKNIVSIIDERESHSSEIAVTVGDDKDKQLVEEKNRVKAKKRGRPHKKEKEKTVDKILKNSDFHRRNRRRQESIMVFE